MGDIVSVVNTLTEKIYQAIEKDVFVLLDELLYINKDILKTEPFKKLDFTSEESSIVLLALSFTTMFAICFAIRKIVSMYTGKPGNTTSFILRMIVFSILAVSSYYICETLLDINFKISEVFIGIAEDITDRKVSFEAIKDTISSLGSEEGFISLNGAIKGMVGFGAVSLLLNFCIRYVTVIFLMIISPISFMMGINMSTFGIFTKWLKTLIVNLFIQNVATVIIMIPLCMEDISSVMFKIVLVGSIYILYKINPFVSDIFSNLSIKKEND